MRQRTQMKRTHVGVGDGDDDGAGVRVGRAAGRVEWTRGRGDLTTVGPGATTTVRVAVEAGFGVGRIVGWAAGWQSCG